MALTVLKQAAVDKIISFDYEELKEWIYSRLQGYDRHFPIDLESKSDPGQFLVDCFFEIENEQFQENFIKILNHLTRHLKSLSREEIKKSKGYISQLLSLCGRIPGFKSKDTLLEIAGSGKFKKIKSGGRELHERLLETLASHHIAGTCEFWLEQLLESPNKDCAYSAFFALKDYPDKLFRHMTAIIDKYKRKIETIIWGILLLLHTHGKNEISKRFKQLETRLSFEQKEAINRAFIEAGFDVLFQLSNWEKKEYLYKLAVPYFRYFDSFSPIYEITPLEEKFARIFDDKGYDVEYNRTFANDQVDLFIKKKKDGSITYNCWLCFCNNGNRKVTKRMVSHVNRVRTAAREELPKEPYLCCNCQAVIISEKGFTKGCIETAREFNIKLTTSEQLISYLLS